jgi:bacillithiol system protein YtxJ
MVEVRQMVSLSDLDAALADSAQRPVLVFKHSTTCPVSARAYGEWQAFLASPEAGRVGHYWVRVIEERPVSLELAHRVGVLHQSPQALLIRNGQALWHDSHYGVTADALKAALHRT